MKSAYELAMERLEKQAPSQKLTEAQKADIAEIDSLYKSKIAEKEVFLQGEITRAKMSGDAEALQSLEKQLATELSRLRQECEEKKEKARHQRQ